jgi:hypothetical protein
MVREGELTATVVMPPTTPAALKALHLYWTGGERADSIVLPPQSFPVLEEVKTA